MKHSSLQRTKHLTTALTYFFLILGAVIMIFPFVWMILTSFKTQTESMQIPPTIFPSHWDLANFVDAVASLPFVNMYVNTALMILFRVICAVVFSSMAGYAFAKLKFRGKNILFGLILVQMSLPSQIFILPQYQMVAKLGMANTVFALVFPGIVSAFGTFFLRQTYMGIPLTIFTAVFAYGDLMWPLVVNSDLKMMTLSSGLATLRGQFSTNFPVLMAGSLLAMLPMVILYMIFQRQFIEGIANTGGK